MLLELKIALADFRRALPEVKRVPAGIRQASLEAKVFLAGCRRRLLKVEVLLAGWVKNDFSRKKEGEGLGFLPKKLYL